MNTALVYCTYSILGALVWSACRYIRRGFPKQEAAATILRTIKLYLDATPQSTLKEVHFVLFDPESVRVYVTELGKLDIAATAAAVLA